MIEFDPRILRDCPVFSRASDDAMAFLETIVETEILEPGDRIVCGREENRQSVWFISEGLVNLTYWDADGKEATLLLLDADDVWVSLEGLEQLSRQIELVALKHTALIRTSEEQIGRLLMRHPELGARLFDFASRRISRLQGRLAELMTKSVRERVASALLQLGTELGEGKREGVGPLSLPVTHDDLARLVGASREMVTKVMGQFREAGWVQSRRKSIHLLNQRALQVVH